MWVRSGAPAAVNGGALCVQGTPPVVFGDGWDGPAFGQQIEAIAQGAPVNVMVVDEFYDT